MTTFKEISSSKKAHYDFFTQRARMNIIFYREHLRVYGKHSGITKLEKAAFRANMKTRRIKDYLNTVVMNN